MMENDLPPPLEGSEPEKINPKPPSILDEGFPYKIRFGQAGLSSERKIKGQNLEVKAKTGLDPKEKAVKMSTKLIDAKEDECPELQAIWDKQQEVRHFVECRSCRSNLIPGVYVVRTAYFMEVRAKIKSGQEELKALVEKFLPVYPAAMERAKVNRLKAAFDVDLYPNNDQIRKGVHIRARIVDIGIDEEKIKSKLGEAVLAEQIEELQADLKDAKAEIQAGLVGEFKKLLLRAQEIVLGTDDGKAKRFRDAAIGNLKDFCKFFDAKDLTGFTELRALVKQTEAAIEGKDPEDIKGSKAIRAEMAKAFAPIVEGLKSEAVLKGTRKVVLD